MPPIFIVFVLASTLQLPHAAIYRVTTVVLFFIVIVVCDLPENLVVIFVVSVGYAEYIAGCVPSWDEMMKSFKNNNLTMLICVTAVI